MDILAKAATSLSSCLPGLMYCGRGDGSDFSVEVDQVIQQQKPSQLKAMSLNHMLKHMICLVPALM